MNLNATISIVKTIDENRIDEILLKVGGLSFSKKIGFTKKEMSKYFEVSVRTIEKYLKENKQELSSYGKTVFKMKSFVADERLDYKLNCKTRRVVLLNRKHILFLACLLANSSVIAKMIVRYLLEIEEKADNDLRINSLVNSMPNICSLENLKKRVELLQKRLLETESIQEFANLMKNSQSEVSINDFAKSTYDSLRIGRNTLFSFMRETKILTRKNFPMQEYIVRGYFKVKIKVINGEVKYQPFLTGKGQLWLFKKIKFKGLR